MLVMDAAFYESLDHLKTRVGRSIPQNVLEYFLKENNGKVDKCIEALRHDGWFQPRHRNDASPTSVVESFQRSNTRTSPPHGLGDTPMHSSMQPSQTKNYYGYSDDFQPPPPFLPKSSSQSTNDTHNHVKIPTNTQRLQQDAMPVQVPFGQLRQFSVPPVSKRTIHRRLSEAERGMVLKIQTESMQSAKGEREDTVGRLEMLKMEVRRKNEEVRNLKRTNSAARVPNEDDMELAKVINDTLRIDIKEEEDKRKKRDWNCQSCSFINSPVMDQCEFCNAPRPSPRNTPSKSLFGRDHNYS